MLIRTKFIGPTNTKGPRVKATSPSGVSIVIPWSHELGIDENHISAATVLKIKLTSEGRGEPILWVRRWELDGTCVHVGLYPTELKLGK